MGSTIEERLQLRVPPLKQVLDLPNKNKSDKVAHCKLARKRKNSLRRSNRLDTFFLRGFFVVVERAVFEIMTLFKYTAGNTDCYIGIQQQLLKLPWV
jgi:hypothetical protein